MNAKRTLIVLLPQLLYALQQKLASLVLMTLFAIQNTAQVLHTVLAGLAFNALRVLNVPVSRALCAQVMSAPLVLIPLFVPRDILEPSRFAIAELVSNVLLMVIVQDRPLIALQQTLVLNVQMIVNA